MHVKAALLIDTTHHHETSMPGEGRTCILTASHTSIVDCMPLANVMLI